MKMKKINFQDKFQMFSDHWSPKVIAEMNDYQFKLVKIKDDFVWLEWVVDISWSVEIVLNFFTVSD